MEKLQFRLKGDKLFYLINGIILTVFFLIVLYPCIFVVSASFSSGDAVNTGKVVLFPVEFSLEGYKTVLRNHDVGGGFLNSIFYTVAGTVINMVVTMICAYPLSRKDLRGRRGLLLFFVFTMYFGGGLIPSYLVNQKLGLVNTRWVMLLPGCMSVYNMLVARTFIMNSIPGELFEASIIDGCSDMKYFTKIVLPLSKAVMAVLVLYYAVGHWNSYMHPVIYLHDRDLYPLTIFLKEILLANKIDTSTISDPDIAAAMTKVAGVMKYALIVVTMIPILLIYPFIQKHFVKGVMIGSVKG